MNKICNILQIEAPSSNDSWQSVSAYTEVEDEQFELINVSEKATSDSSQSSTLDVDFNS